MRLILLLIASLMLTSCSSQFAYRHLDWLILWYSGDYLDLSRQQEGIFADEVSNLLNWHSESELPKYRLQLKAIQDDLNALPLSSTLIAEHIAQIRGHWQRTRQQISEQLAPLTVQLSSNQIEYLFRQLEARNQERLSEHSQLSPSEIKDDAIERLEETLIDWLGSIDRMQSQLMYEFIDKRYDTTVDRVAYLRAYQSQLKMALSASVEVDKLQILLNNPDAYKSPDYLSKQANNLQHTVEFIRDLSVQLQPKQVRHVQNKLQDYINTIDGIIKSRQ
ncbi:MAG: hypothetical protein ACJA1U_000730 [Bermanella sp.]|jgi:hypothetical protein